MLMRVSLRSVCFCLLSSSWLAYAADVPEQTATAVFAGGCFWCVESDFEKVDGVVEAISGYTAGNTKNPTYAEVSAGGTGHTEAVKIIYDPAIVSYEDLLNIYWKSIDPSTKNQQFCDVGNQYRSGIYYQNEAQKAAALASLEALKQTGRFKEIYTEIEPLGPFYDAEQYHQDYYKINPIRYRFYRFNCGRDSRLKEIWD